MVVIRFNGTGLSHIVNHIHTFRICRNSTNGLTKVTNFLLVSFVRHCTQ